jgi:hypothetical protein
MNSRLINQGFPVEMLGSGGVNLTHSAGSGLWVSLKNNNRLQIVLSQGAWNSGTPAVTLQQAKDANGTGAKALVFDKYWQVTGQQNPATNVPVATAVVAGTFNLPATPGTVTVIDLWAPNDLDVNNGYCYVQLVVGTFSGDLAGIGQPYDAAISAEAAQLPNALA